MALNDFLNILEQYRGSSAAAAPASVEQDYSQVAPSAPPEHLAGGLSRAFQSAESGGFGQMIGTLFGNSNGEQRAGILNHLLGAVEPGVLPSLGLGGLGGMLAGGNTVTPEQANQIAPGTVEQLAEHAKAQNPSIVEQASAFYAQHPTLVKALGAGSLALIMSHLSQR